MNGYDFPISHISAVYEIIRPYDDLRVLESYWAIMNAHCSDFTIYLWATSAISTSVLIGASFVHFTMDFIPYLRKYKLQPTKPPTLSLYSKCVKLALLNHVLIHIGLLSINVPLFRYQKISVTTPLPKP